MIISEKEKRSRSTHTLEHTHLDTASRASSERARLMLSADLPASPVQAKPASEVVQKGIFQSVCQMLLFTFSIFFFLINFTAQATWSSAQKVGVGTSYEAYDLDGKYSALSPTAPISKVWFTLAKGVLTETYWPTVDTAQTQKTQILIFNGNTFEKEEDQNHTIEWLDNEAPLFRVTTQDKKNRFTIIKEIFSHPEKNVVFVRYDIAPHIAGLIFHLSHHPRVHNNDSNDRGEIINDVLLAYEDNHSQSLKSSIPFKKSRVESNQDVQFLGEIRSPADRGVMSFTLALGFGFSSEEAIQTVESALAQDYTTLKHQFITEWKSYFQNILNLSPFSKNQEKKLFYRSAIALKSHEDKTYPGAIVASLSIPWGDKLSNTHSLHKISSSRGTGGYHLIWPRDLFHIARAFMAMHDHETAKHILNYFKTLQYSEKEGFWYLGPRTIPKKGAFPQNAWVDGTSFWGGLQMDQVAFPLILTWHLWKKGIIDIENYWAMIKEAAHLIAIYGPWTHQERWEENYGISPSTVAAQISALICAADLASAKGFQEESSFWLKTADQWSLKPNDNIESWTFTHTGLWGNGKYFLRLDGASRFSEKDPDYFALWDPNDNKKIVLSNQSGIFLEKEIVDGGFLELVRYGVRSPTNEYILDSLPEYDEKIKVQTPVGPAWYRYLHDGYGEDGKGKLWPFLTAERAQYELALLLKRKSNPKVIHHILGEYIETLEHFSNEGGFFPEQVWENGKPTGSATPLLWTHAEYIKLLASKAEQKPFDVLPMVYERYKDY